MILHRNCEGTEQLRLFLMSRLSNDVSVKNMSSDLLSGQTLNRGSEEQTVSDRSLPPHCSICRLITGTRCIIPCKGKSQPSGAYRFKLPVLVNHPYNRIRKYRTVFLPISGDLITISISITAMLNAIRLLSLIRTIPSFSMLMV